MTFPSRDLKFDEIPEGFRQNLDFLRGDTLVNPSNMGLNGRALEQQLKELNPSQRNVPLARPFKYVGYSINATARAVQHDKGDTSWFHHMALDAFRLEAPDAGFVFHGHVVCYLAIPEEVPVAESLVGRMTNSMIETGSGFGVFQGGVQTTSARLLGLDEAGRAAVWAQCERWRLENTPYSRDLELEYQRLVEIEKTQSLMKQRKPSKNTPSRIKLLQEQLDEKTERVRVMEAEVAAMSARPRARRADMKEILDQLEQDVLSCPNDKGLLEAIQIIYSRMSEDSKPEEDKPGERVQ